MQKLTIKNHVSQQIKELKEFFDGVPEQDHLSAEECELLLEQLNVLVRNMSVYAHFINQDEELADQGKSVIEKINTLGAKNQKISEEIAKKLEAPELKTTGRAIIEPVIPAVTEVEDSKAEITGRAITEPVIPAVQKQEVEISGKTITETVKSVVTAAPEPEIKNSPITTAKVANNKNMEVGLNDKFRFIQELFRKQQDKYIEVIQQINSLETWQEARNYIDLQARIYNWKEEDQLVKTFYKLAEKRFV